MNKKRRIKNKVYSLLSIGSAIILVSVLFSILFFIFKNGLSQLDLDLIRKPYWAENIVLNLNSVKKSEFDIKNIDKLENFSVKYGIAVENQINQENELELILVHIDEKSSFFDIDKSLELDSSIERLSYYDSNQELKNMGSIYGTSASEFIDELDSSTGLEELYYRTESGGISGSLKATLYLILLSLLFALPIGVFTAVYIEEISFNERLNSLMSKSIELLAGVPSIIFGLMGVVILFPLTAFFRVKGLSILLGSLTMAIILLPIIIRSVQETLKTIPNELRFASYALGATQTETIFKIVLPQAFDGIISATLLAISRIIGESAALIYTMGSFVNDKPQIKESATSLSVHIWSIMNQEQPNFQLASSISIIILLLVLVLNLFVRFLSRERNV